MGAIDWQLEPVSEGLLTAGLEDSRRDGAGHYFFPRERGEMDRLDVQHYALREVVGANFLAPVEQPQRVLDVGCGTGQWAFDICHQFPEALVVGFDLVSGKSGWPPRYRLVKGNLLQGLPFAEGQFDLVHERLLVSGVPVTTWPSLVSDLVRTTRPGGWVELAEPPLGFATTGPATARLFGLWGELARQRGLEAGSEVFDELDRYLRDAGLEDVERHEIEVPVGEWGGRAGSLMMTDFRATATRVCEILQAQSRLSSEQAEEVIRAAQQETESRRLSWSIAIAFGRKPAR
jgi:SAM-dependent methyltransferase